LKIILTQLWSKSMFFMSVNFNDAIFDNVLSFENVLKTHILRALINQSFTLMSDLSFNLLDFSQLTIVAAWTCFISSNISISAWFISCMYFCDSWHFIKWWRLEKTLISVWSKNLNCSQFLLNHNVFRTMNRLWACSFIWAKCSLFWAVLSEFLLIKDLCRFSRFLIAMKVQYSR
jgi:hypothetical protein